MDNEHIAAMLAGQTAVQSLIIEIMIESGIIGREAISNKLYDLLAAEGGRGPGSAPVKHLISLVERLET